MRDLLEWLEGSLTEEEAVKSYVDPKQIDLLGEYQKLNKKLYGGKLGAYPMKWNRRKRAGALVKSRRIGLEWKVISVEVSVAYAQTYQGFLDRLAHELIHVYWIEQGNIKAKHGPLFKQEMNRINRMNAGVHVTLTESPSSGEIGSFIGKGKKMGVLLMAQGRDKGRGAMIVAKNNIGKMTAHLDQLLPSMTAHYSFMVYEYDAPWLQEFGARRVSRAIRWNKFSPEQYKEVQDNGKFLGRVSKTYGWSPE